MFVRKVIGLFEEEFIESKEATGMIVVIVRKRPSGDGNCFIAARFFGETIKWVAARETVSEARQKRPNNAAKKSS
jgi:hypothetical protein